MTSATTREIGKRSGRTTFARVNVCAFTYGGKILPGPGLRREVRAATGTPASARIFKRTLLDTP